MRFKGFEGGWTQRKLGEFVVLVSGIPLQSEEISEDKSGVPILRGINVTEGFVRHNLEIDRYYTKAITDKIQKYLLDKNDIVIGMDGSKVGKNVALISEYDAGSILIQRVARLKALSNSDTHYIFQRIYSNEFQKYVDLVNTSSGIPHISLKQIQDYQTGFPALAEQQKIASFLTLLDQRISTQSKIISHWKSLMQNLGELLFIQRVRFKMDKNGGATKWNEKKGNEMFENISNKQHDSDLPILAITQEHGAIPRNLIDYQISVTDKSIESYKVVEQGDFIISLRSFEGGIEYSNYRGICSPAYIVLRSKMSIDNHFFKYYFKTSSYIKLLNKKLEGIRDGKMVSYKYFSEIPLPYPPKNEQTKIAQCLQSLAQKIADEKSILQQYEKQKKFFLEKMFI